MLRISLTTNSRRFPKPAKEDAFSLYQGTHRHHSNGELGPYHEIRTLGARITLGSYVLANKSNFCLTLQRDYHHHSLVDPETHSYTSGNKEGTSCPSGNYLGTYLPDYLHTQVSNMEGASFPLGHEPP